MSPYFVGKPNSLMMRTALRYLGEHFENTIMVGDQMRRLMFIPEGIKARAGDRAGIDGHDPTRRCGPFSLSPHTQVKSVAELEQDL